MHYEEQLKMEIKELSFLDNLSDNGKETSSKDSVIGGHSYDYSYDFDGYFPHPLLDKLKDFDLGNITIEVTEPEPKPEMSLGSFSMATAAPSGAGVPGYPF